MFLILILLAIIVAAASGLPGFVLRRPKRGGEGIAVAGMLCAACAGLAGAVGALLGHGVETLALKWPAVGGGSVGLDALSAFFLVPVFLVGGLGPVYGLGYWPHRRHPANGRRLRFFWGVLVAGMALLVIARHALTFLLGWEMMALSAFFLVATEDHRSASRQAGWIYLISTHCCTLALLALFAVWRQATGSFDMVPAALHTFGPGTASLCVGLVLVGFGVKAGMMPLHFWLPGAHANAPSHVSAIMSGVVIKMGIYGMVRWCALLPEAPVAWGELVLLLGALSSVLGVLFAIGQHDLKRLLAYHSVENIGIILMGFGLALLGRALHRPEWVVLGLGACLLHVWNHSLFKSLLFLCAGAVAHAAGTRQMDRLGGLARRMPWTAVAFLVGAVAICGLPPLNGFVSEWLLYIGLLKGVTGAAGGAFAALVGVPVLAMTGALALACFVKVMGTVFLGEPRTLRAAQAHEVSRCERLPMAVLVSGCVFIGVCPSLAVPALNAAVSCWLQGSDLAVTSVAQAVPLGVIPLIALLLFVCAAGIVWRLRLWKEAAALRDRLTWDCGYARPDARMQYTASSFARTLVSLFSGVLKPIEHRPQVEGLFPMPTHTHSHVDEAVLDRVLVPAARKVEAAFIWLHRFQRGLTQHYVLYVLLMLLMLLCTLCPFRHWVAVWLKQ
ncbi:MAG TPA: proton-conducting transporter membrane subunit [Kiritimatiellia bacterium]|nr:proton-conducting transporter membrane subunit [Kiritimatiellia bacterium]HRU69847.1 proton-conducting transporter membrane subunit [Kiritimatiellia bacterium]